MLSRLYIKNIALIDEADIEFDKGLNILSGETGAGKSVILDSVNFVLGSKADKTMIRYGEQEAFVKAEFCVSPESAAAAKLKDYDIETDGNIIITRRLSLDGKNAIKINGSSVTAAMLKSVTQHIVDVHGQSEHFFLLNEDNQLKILDNLLGEKALEIKERLSKLVAEKKGYSDKIASLGGDEAERERKLDLLSYQISEIESADVIIGEFDELKARQRKLMNLERILTALNTAKEYLDGDNGARDSLYYAVREINHISSLSDEYADFSATLEGIHAEIDDACTALSDLSDELTFDENEAQNVDDRLSLLKKLRKKYGADEEEILNFLEKAQKEYDAIKNSAELIEEYQAKIDKCDDKIYKLYVDLTKLRKETATAFCASVEEELKTLNIPDAIFGVQFNEYDRFTVNTNNANGADEISFQFSANKGEPAKPLNKVISGGEMSRFMLAIKTRLKDFNGISSYLFDEIDAGISGYTAGTVARKFMEIAKHTQILAVSHLPQVCAASDAQFLIYKVEEKGKTYTKVRRLNSDEKIEEIVRLTGSIKSESAIQHAKELISQFKK